MQAATATRLIDQLRRELDAPATHAPFRIDADRYRSDAWLARERAALFGGPRIATTSSAVAPGSCHPHDGSVVVRDADGRLRAFANACRHRATRLVDAPCAAKALVCPYHGWTYDLAGALIHVPHREAFAGVELDGRGLVPRPVEERHGLVWLGAGVDAYLGELGPDLAALGLAGYVPYRTARITRRCNWKLVIEAFLDGYHIRILHRDSIYRFFLDAASVTEPVGQHIRAITGRRAMREATAGDPRELATPSFLVFPATILIAHPDFVSIITVRPLAPDLTDYEHLMVIPADRAGELDHWARSWRLIEETVFQNEDLWVCEQAQHGIAAGSDELLFGGLGHAVRWFHDAIDQAVTTDGSMRTTSAVATPSRRA